jgi:CheY-like chemotaxis protein
MTARGDELRFLVADRGIGMEPHVIERAFDLFFQADSSLERARGGLGIGLTMVKRLVDLHGGSVHTRSEGAGKGSEIEVVLPLSRRLDAAIRPSAEPTSSRRPLVRRKILLIEDNEDCREALQELLEDAGHSVVTAQDGLAGVRAALAEPYDIAFVDLGLPGLNGLEVAREIRARGASDLRLVALTGYGGPEQHTQALAAGFDKHLVKPVIASSLWQVLDDSDDLWRAARPTAQGMR